MFNEARNQQIVDEAADWAVRIDAGDMQQSDKEALADWLRESPRHVEELLTLGSIFSGLEKVDPQRQLSVDELLKNMTGDVAVLSPDARMKNGVSPAGKTGYARIAAFAAAIACVSLALIFLFVEQPSHQVYATALGEQRSISLEDGSVVHVNTQSEIQVAYTASERRILLLNGEAMFDVKKDPQRPFRVVANKAIAEAVGTRFNIRYRDDEVSVVVLEGEVAVVTQDTDNTTGQLLQPDSANVTNTDGNRILLTSGEKIAISPASEQPAAVVTADIEATESWRSRQLVFESQTLRKIVSEFNRYNRLQIVILSDSIARHEFSGLFQADDPWSFVAFLELTGDITVDAVPGQIHLKKNLSRASRDRQ